MEICIFGISASNAFIEYKFYDFIREIKINVNFAAVGKSFTTSSCQIPQAGNGARVDGCSGAMEVAYPSFFIKMRLKHIIIALLICLCGRNSAQTIYGALAPDSVRKKCEAVIINEIGQNAYNNNVKFIKSDGHTKEKVLNGFTLFYSFNFPNVKESHVIFTLEYKFGKGVVKDIAFKNYTRLPASIKKNGAKVVSYEEAKKAALNADTTLKKFSDKLYGEISTEYDDTKKEYYFVWYFYYLEACKNCEAEMYTTHSVYVNATNGKVINTSAKK